MVIALERDGEVVAGVTHNPVTNDTYWTEKGKGRLQTNDRRLRVAARRKLDECLFATGVPFMGKPGHGQFLKELHQISARVAGVRRFGSAALDLAWVASGQYDGYWERDLKPWDTAAGGLLVLEAGGAVSAVGGERFKPRLGHRVRRQPGAPPPAAGAAEGGGLRRETARRAFRAEDEGESR